MANHGICRNCWWYYQLHGTRYRIQNNKLLETPGDGICYMLSGQHDLYHTTEGSYCPDYFNRNRRKQTLQQWMEEHNIPIPEA